MGELSHLSLWPGWSIVEERMTLYSKPGLKAVKEISVVPVKVMIKDHHVHLCTGVIPTTSILALMAPLSDARDLR